MTNGSASLSSHGSWNTESMFAPWSAANRIASTEMPAWSGSDGPGETTIPRRSAVGSAVAGVTAASVDAVARVSRAMREIGRLDGL